MKNALMLSGLFAGLSSLPAMAQEGLETIGKPVDGGLGFQPAATELAEGIHTLDNMILVIITAVCVFVGRAAALGDRALTTAVPTRPRRPLPTTPRSRLPGPLCRS